MEEPDLRELSCAAKIARIVLENCGPLSPTEVAEEAYVSTDRARRGLIELADHDLAEPVCGVCEEREEVYALTKRAAEPNT